MTKRYYYTDPLKVAWMIREFGFRFANEHTGAELRLGIQGDEPLLMGAGFGTKWDRYYVHPDSYELLKPKSNDYTLEGNIRFNEAIPPVLCVYEPYEGYYKKITGFREVTYKDWFSKQEHKETFAIIHRDNKAWFDPIEEENE